MQQLISIAILLAALGSGVMAGLYFVFSIAVMPALASLQPPVGIAAMQSINKVIVNPVFFVAFFGTALVCLALIVAIAVGAGGGFLILAACLLYLVGNIVVTVAFNVPLNNQLAAVDPAGAEGAEVWARYLDVWTKWNHVRTLSCLAATALMIAPRTLT